VFGLPDVGEKRHRQVPPQFMTELYNNIADQSGFTRRRSPYNATVIRSFIERGKWLKVMLLGLNQVLQKSDTFYFRVQYCVQAVYSFVQKPDLESGEMRELQKY
jgi:hypothetical protein